jgi:hypothetical protein
MSRRSLSGRDRLANIAIPQSGHRLGVSGALGLDGMAGLVGALDVDRRDSVGFLTGRMGFR